MRNAAPTFKLIRTNFTFLHVQKKNETTTTAAAAAAATS